MKYKRHEIDEKILTQEQLNKIILDIKLTESQLEIPIPAEYLRAEEISKIARIDACIWNEDIMVIIDIPVVSRETYRFYKMHPLSSQQYTQGSSLLSNKFTGIMLGYAKHLFRYAVS